MNYAVDTVALVKYNANLKIGKTAQDVLEEADNGNNTIFIPVIVPMEIMYLAEKNRITFNLKDLDTLLQTASNYYVVELDFNIILTASQLTGKNLELHDRLIVATAVNLGIPLITNDRIVTDSGFVNIIWD